MNDINDNELKEKTSKRVKALRLKYGFTMEVLAKKIGVSKSTIAKWENGYVDNMRQDNIIKLAETFNVSPLFILGCDDDSEQAKEEHIISLYHRLDAYQRQIVDQMITALVNGK